MILLDFVRKFLDNFEYCKLIKHVWFILMALNLNEWQLQSYIHTHTHAIMQTTIQSARNFVFSSLSTTHCHICEISSMSGKYGKFYPYIKLNMLSLHITTLFWLFVSRDFKSIILIKICANNIFGVVVAVGRASIHCYCCVTEKKNVLHAYFYTANAERGQYMSQQEIEREKVHNILHEIVRTSIIISEQY